MGLNAFGSLGPSLQPAGASASSDNFSGPLGLRLVLNPQGERLQRDLWLALLAHLLTLALVALIILLAQLLHWQLPWLTPPKMQPKELEFVLVDAPKAPPRDPKTLNRAQHSTRSGGKAVPNTKPAETRQISGAKAAQTAQPKAATPSQPVSKPQPQKQPQKQPQPQPKMVAPIPEKQPQPQKQPKIQPKATAPQPPKPSARPVPQPTAVRAPSPVPSAIRMPAPPAPKPVDLGPLGGPSGSSSSKGTATGRRSPTQISGTPGGGGSPSPSSSGSRPSGGTGRGSFSQVGSPGGGGGPDGIDAQEEPDFGPYIAELQRRIKRNWQPPSDNRNKTIVVVFEIGRDGRLLDVSMKQSSGVSVADQAAIQAVRASAPFRPLPANFKGDRIPVHFTFDYNVFTGRLN